MSAPLRIDVARRTVAAWAALALALPAPALARSVLVIGPHEDDETLLGAGRTREAVLAGDDVHVVLVTNGDINGTAEGLRRQGESVDAAALLGVPEQNVVFLGYGDQLVDDLFLAASGTQVYRSAAGQTATYGTRGLGGMDFHRYRTGAAGPYTRDTILGDFKALITTFRPDVVYTVSRFDNHGDHEATSKLLHEALVALAREGGAPHVTVFETVVWAPYANGGCYGDWPPAGSGPLPYPPFPAPQCVGPGTPLDWNAIRRYPVPAEMQARDAATNLKWRALEAYPTQFSDFLTSFVRKDEFFWRYDYRTLVSYLASVSASSDYPEGSGGKAHAIDGYPDVEHEWKSLDDAGAWIQLDWPSAVRVAQVNLQDRIDAADNVLAGTLAFSDGTSIDVGALPTGGKPLVVTFPPKTVSWIRFTITRSQGSTPGLSELEVLGVPASDAENVPPHILRGPLPTTRSISFTQTAALSVEAHDLDDDPLQYEWSADGGAVVGSGPSAVFVPPVVGTSTIFTVTVRVSDARGGAESSSAFVTVTTASAQGLGISPSSVAAGQPATGTVVLSEPAPAGGLAVPLSSSAPAVATVPASVTVPAAVRSATFPIATGTVAAPTLAVVTASLGGGDATATLTVNPPIPAALALSPASVVGGASAQATVTLTAAAPGAGVVLQLSSADPTVAAVPATLTVPGGAATASFTVATAPVSSPRGVSITATDGSASASAILTVAPLTLTGLAVAPASVVGGLTPSGTVTLSGAAGPGGVEVSLASAAPAVATVAPAIVVPEGASSASFPVTTVPTGATASAVISATALGVTRTATVTVTAPALSTLVLAPTSVVGGASAAGTVTLTGAAPAGGLTVALASAKPAIVAVPASVTIPEGASSAPFILSTSPVTAATSAVVTASRAGVTRTATLGVTAILVNAVKLSPASVTGGATSTATVTMTAVAPMPLVVPLASGNAVARVPATVTVPAGSASATFQVATDAVAASTTAAISATYGRTRSATLTVKPPAMSTLALAAASVVGGASTTATVTLTGPAPAAGAPVTLASSRPAVAVVPATLIVPAGARTATFAVSTAAVTANTSSSISAAAGGVTRSATLTVTAKPAALSITLSPATVASGGTTSATVVLNAPAAAAGTTVTLRSSNTAVATVPASAVVPAGATTVVVPVAAATVGATSTASISAVAGGITKSATLSVTP